MGFDRDDGFWRGRDGTQASSGTADRAPLPRLLALGTAPPRPLPYGPDALARPRPLARRGFRGTAVFPLLRSRRYHLLLSPQGDVK